MECVRDRWHPCSAGGRGHSGLTYRRATPWADVSPGTSGTSLGRVFRAHAAHTNAARLTCDLHPPVGGPGAPCRGGCWRDDVRPGRTARPRALAQSPPAECPGFVTRRRAWAGHAARCTPAQCANSRRPHCSATSRSQSADVRRGALRGRSPVTGPTARAGFPRECPRCRSVSANWTLLSLRPSASRYAYLGEGEVEVAKLVRRDPAAALVGRARKPRDAPARAPAPHARQRCQRAARERPHRWP
jgi:hypothetical protein